MSNTAIKVDDLWKEYRIGLKKSTSFRESISHAFKKEEAEYFWALKDLSFEVNRGDAIGIIGKNGAGKSTLLKVLSKITYPTKGRIEINGRVSSLLEVGTGFHPELTGRQNIFLNGTILGMTRREVQAKFDEIVDFSGVEKFIDTPVKRYSSGMKVRLAFSVAAHLEPEILIIDEVLAVGDAEFQKKCLGKMEDVTSEGRTVLFVSHNIPAVERLCNRGIVIDHGKMLFQGSASEAISEYLGKVRAIASSTEASFDENVSAKMSITGMKVEALQSAQIETGGEVIITLNYSIHDLDHVYNHCHFSIAIKDIDERKVIHHSTRIDAKTFSHEEIVSNEKLVFRIEQFLLKPGRYTISANAVQANEFLDRKDDAISFDLEESRNEHLVSDVHSGIFLPKASWGFEI